MEDDAELHATSVMRYEADQQAAYNVNMTNWWQHLYRGLDGTIESTGIVQGGVNGVLGPP